MACKLLFDKFTYFDEVDTISAEIDNFEIDPVCRCSNSGHILGWKFKLSHSFKQELATALRRAIHYRVALITDKRLLELHGPRLLAIAIFPGWLGEHDEPGSSYAREADGMRLLASHFRVGTMRWTGQDRLSFIMGESAICHSNSGWGGNAAGVLLGERKLGTAKRVDK